MVVGIPGYRNWSSKCFIFTPLFSREVGVFRLPANPARSSGSSFRAGSGTCVELLSLFFFEHNLFVDEQSIPGDSSRDLFIPNRWRSLKALKGSRKSIPKRSPAELPGIGILWYFWYSKWPQNQLEGMSCTYWKWISWSFLVNYDLWISQVSLVISSRDTVFSLSFQNGCFRK